MYTGLSNLGLNAISSAFSPSNLFASGEQGAWYDPSDFSTMFQDAAGTTPVTAVGQPVGLILDKRFGGVRGVEMWDNAKRGFTGTSSEVSLGVYRIFTPDGTNTAVTQFGGANMAPGAWYEATFNVDSVTAAGGGLIVDNGLGSGPSITATVGPKRAIFQSANTSPGAIKRAAGTTDIQISGVSFRPLPGNHASQATSASRPVLSARYNKCANSNANPVDLSGTSFTNAPNGLAAMTVVDDSAALAAVGLSSVCSSGKVYKLDNSAGDGQANAFFSGSTGNTNPHTGSCFIRGGTGLFAASLSADGNAAIGASAVYVRRTIAITPTATNRTISVRADAGQVLYFILNDLREASDAYLPTPQVVRADGTYDTAGFPYYLSFDGVDDSLSTGNVDFSSTAKVTVFAGLSKLSDANTGIVFEGASGGGSPFSLNAPRDLGAVGNFSFTMRGGGQSEGKSNTMLAPASAVVSGLLDFSQATVAAENIIRINGVQGLTATGTLATWASIPAMAYSVGRRNDGTLPFNGRLYGLVIRGAATPDSSITQTERYIASKMGVTL